MFRPPGNPERFPIPCDLPNGVCVPLSPLILKLPTRSLLSPWTFFVTSSATSCSGSYTGHCVSPPPVPDWRESHAVPCFLYLLFSGIPAFSSLHYQKIRRDDAENPLHFLVRRNSNLIFRYIFLSIPPLKGRVFKQDGARGCFFHEPLRAPARTLVSPVRFAEFRAAFERFALFAPDFFPPQVSSNDVTSTSRFFSG